MNRLKALLQVIGMVLLPLILFNIVLYGICAFIALDVNPTHWWLLQQATGRVIIAILELAIILSVPDFWKAIDDKYNF